MIVKRQCKDCAIEYAVKYAASEDDKLPPMPKRPAPFPGPRCATHDRVERKRVKSVAHERKVQATYGLQPGEYEQLYTLQNGTCALCRRATGKSKRLAVDHDHKTGQPRGLLCGPCNQLLGHGRDDPDFFQRIIEYLKLSPYTEMLWLNHQNPSSMVPSRSAQIARLAEEAGLEY